MWEGLSLLHDTKLRNCKGEIVDRTMIFIWSLIHGSSWSGLIKAEPTEYYTRWTAHNSTETERSSGWLPWSSLGTLKLTFNVSSDEQGSHPDDLSVSVNVIINEVQHISDNLGQYNTWSCPHLCSEVASSHCIDHISHTLKYELNETFIID